MASLIGTLSKALIKLAQQEEAIDAKILPLLLAIRNEISIDIDKFTAANRKDLETIASLANGHIEYLGAGGEGHAWKIGNDKAQYVLKLSHTPRIDFKADTKETSSRLWEAKPGAQHEPAIHSSGKLKIIHYGARSDMDVWWKVIELLDTESIDRHEIKTIVAGIKNLYNNTVCNKIDVTHPTIRKDVAAVLAAKLRASNSKLLVLSIMDLDDVLATNWLEDFIDGTLYMIESRKKTDFMAGNVGIREATGQLIWFDS